MKPDLEAIRARDAAWRSSVDIPSEKPSQMYRDRRALLAHVDELREAAGKVTCKYCGGLGWIIPLQEDDRAFEEAPCQDCADLRALLGESHE